MIAKLLKKKKAKKNLTSSQRKETQYLRVSKSNREAGFYTERIEVEKEQNDIFNMLWADSANLELFAQWEQPSEMSVREQKRFSNK